MFFYLPVTAVVTPSPAKKLFQTFFKRLFQFQAQTAEHNHARVFSLRNPFTYSAAIFHLVMFEQLLLGYCLPDKGLLGLMLCRTESEALATGPNTQLLIKVVKTTFSKKGQEN